LFIFQADLVVPVQLPDHGSKDLETKKTGHPAVSSAVADLTPGRHHSWVSTQLNEKKNLGSIHGFLATLHTMKI
jgi:hypothetical protein